MIKDVYKINNEGVYVDIYKINTDENTYYDGFEWVGIDFDYVELPPPHAKVTKWEVNKWVVIEEYPVEPQPPQEPTIEERLQQTENTLLYLLMGGI
jgi:hypothetical protein